MGQVQEAAQLHRAYQKPCHELDIVIIDDAKSMCGIFKTLFQSIGLPPPRIFQDVHLALKSMISSPPDLVILDWIMEPINGLYLLKVIRSKKFDPLCYSAVLMITGNRRNSFVVDAVESGTQGLLFKPISPNDLLKHIKCITQLPHKLYANGDRVELYQADQMLNRLKGYIYTPQFDSETWPDDWINQPANMATRQEMARRIKESSKPANDEDGQPTGTSESGNKAEGENTRDGENLFYI